MFSIGAMSRSGASWETAAIIAPHRCGADADIVAEGAEVDPQTLAEAVGGPRSKREFAWAFS
jgi:hypothetical protein